MSATIDQQKFRDYTKYKNVTIHQGGALVQSSECQPFRIQSQDPNSPGIRYLVLELFRTGAVSKYEGKEEVALTGYSLRRFYSYDKIGFSDDEQEEMTLEAMRLEIFRVYIQQQFVTVFINLKVPETGDERVYKLSATVNGGSIWGLILGRANS